MQTHTPEGVKEHLGRTLDKAALNQEHVSYTRQNKALYFIKSASLNFIKTEYFKTEFREKVLLKIHQ